MAKRGLTGNEKQVLYGLVRHPTLNDRELSELLGVKVSTVTAIRRRLRRADYFVARRIPMMHRLGWELLAGGHARLDVTQASQVVSRVRDLLKDRLPNLFHVAVSPDHLLFLAAAPNYSTLRRDLDELRQALDRAKLLTEDDLHTTVFPMDLSVVPTFFDYSHVLALAFGLDERVSFKVEHPRPEPFDLTRKETDVLKGLVRYPELSDKGLAQKVKVSRQAVSKMRREFEEQGILRTARLPNLRTLGFELFVDTFVTYSPAASLKVRTEATERVLRQTSIYCFLSNESETVSLSASETYENFATLRTNLAKYFEERGFYAGEPFFHVGLVRMTELVRNAEFGPMVQSLTERGSRRDR